MTPKNRFAAFLFVRTSVWDIHQKNVIVSIGVPCNWKFCNNTVGKTVHLIIWHTTGIEFFGLIPENYTESVCWQSSLKTEERSSFTLTSFCSATKCGWFMIWIAWLAFTEACELSFCTACYVCPGSLQNGVKSIFESSSFMVSFSWNLRQQWMDRNRQWRIKERNL